MSERHFGTYFGRVSDPREKIAEGDLRAVAIGVGDDLVIRYDAEYDAETGELLSLSATVNVGLVVEAEDVVEQLPGERLALPPGEEDR